MAFKRLPFTAAAIALILACTLAQAVNIETVPVGDPGNAGELSGAGAGGVGPDRICGAVGHTYRMGKYEVTAGQYTAFLNAVAKTDTYGLYNMKMADPVTYWGACNIQRSGSPGSYTYSVASDWANRPVNYVSWGDAARFANWMRNGQPTGPQNASTTEDGSYGLNGATSDAALLAVKRKANATWVIPSEDEWYKAAYYDPAKPGGAGYWDYPTRTDTLPSNVLALTGTNNANYNDYDFENGIEHYTIGAPYYQTTVGDFACSPGPYGTFDQGGNVAEWNEQVVFDMAFSQRGGGAFLISVLLHAADPSNQWPTTESETAGFRIACVPEPATLSLLALGGLAMTRRRR